MRARSCACGRSFSRGREREKERERELLPAQVRRRVCSRARNNPGAGCLTHPRPPSALVPPPPSSVRPARSPQPARSRGESRPVQSGPYGPAADGRPVRSAGRHAFCLGRKTGDGAFSSPSRSHLLVRSLSLQRAGTTAGTPRRGPPHWHLPPPRLLRGLRERRNLRNLGPRGLDDGPQRLGDARPRMVKLRPYGQALP